MDKQPFDYGDNEQPEPSWLHEDAPVNHEGLKKLRSLADIRIIGATVTVAALWATLGIAAKKSHSEKSPEKCPAPLASDIKAVQNLLAQPKIQERNIAANKYSVTMLNGSYAASMINGVNTINIKGFNNSLTTANQFMSQYNMKISLINEDEAKFEENSRQEKVRLPSANSLTSKNTKNIIMNIVEGTMALPVEYVHLSGIKRVVLYNGPKLNKKSTVTAAFVDNIDAHYRDTIFYNVNVPYASFIPHELYHKVDKRECGGADSTYNDPEFTTLNKGEIYKKGQLGALALINSKVRKQKNLLEKNKFKSMQGGNKEEYCRIVDIEQKADAKIVSPTDYSLTNVIEDKAEIGQVLASPNKFDEFLNPAHPKLKKKFEFLLARLYHFRPKLASYFIAVGDRPHPNPPRYKC